MQICNQCDYTNNNEATFCNRCGNHLKGAQNPLIDRIIDKYQLKERIGGGGFGTVYRAVHIELHNPFAIKILHPHLSEDSQMVQRFQREARLLANLRHHNIVQVIDFGHIEGLGFYLVMEWLEGHTLQWHLKHEGLPPREILVQIFDQLLDALHHAHEQGIVHRDLKPENLVLLPGKRMRRVLKILDFGIATMVTERGGSRLTETGLAVGTPRYMAPEQAAGSIDKVDHRADIYSVGVLLSELLTGQQLYGGTTNEVLLHQIETPAPRLSDLAPGIPFPPALEWIVQRALAKEPEKRFTSAEEFSDALLAALDDTPNPTPGVIPPNTGNNPSFYPSGGYPSSPNVSAQQILQHPQHPMAPMASGPYSHPPQPIPPHQHPLAETRALPQSTPRPPTSLLEVAAPSTSAMYRGEKQSQAVSAPIPTPVQPKQTNPLFWVGIAILGGLGLVLLVIIVSTEDTNPPPRQALAPLTRKPMGLPRALPGLPPQPPQPSHTVHKRTLPTLPPASRQPTVPDVSQPEKKATVPGKRLPPPLRLPTLRRHAKRRRIRRIRRRKRRRRRRRRRQVPPRQHTTNAVVSIYIQSIPSKASIMINGRAKGTTPLRIRTKAGTTLEVRLTKSGYFQKTTRYRVKKRNTLTIRLVKNIF